MRMPFGTVDTLQQSVVSFQELQVVRVCRDGLLVRPLDDVGQEWWDADAEKMHGEWSRDSGLEPEHRENLLLLCGPKHMVSRFGFYGFPQFA